MLQMVSNNLHMHVQMQAHAHIYAHTCKHIIDINHNFYKVRNAISEPCETWFISTSTSQWTQTRNMISMCMPMHVHHMHMKVYCKVLGIPMCEIMDFIDKTNQNHWNPNAYAWWSLGWNSLPFYETPTMVVQCTTTCNSCASNCALQIHNCWTNMVFKATTKSKHQQPTVTRTNQHWCDQACEEPLPMHKGDVLFQKNTISQKNAHPGLQIFPSRCMVNLADIKSSPLFSRLQWWEWSGFFFEICVCLVFFLQCWFSIPASSTSICIYIWNPYATHLIRHLVPSCIDSCMCATVCLLLFCLFEIFFLHLHVHANVLHTVDVYVYATCIVFVLVFVDS